MDLVFAVNSMNISVGLIVDDICRESSSSLVASYLLSVLIPLASMFLAVVSEFSWTRVKFFAWFLYFLSGDVRWGFGLSSTFLSDELHLKTCDGSFFRVGL